MLAMTAKDGRSVDGEDGAVHAASAAAAAAAARSCACIPFFHQYEAIDRNLPLMSSLYKPSGKLVMSNDH
jgi:hypothetical protein